MEKIMKRITSVSLPVAALVVALSAGDARAQSNPWSLSFDLSTQVALNGDLHGGGSGTVLSLPTQVEARSYGDIYGNGFSWAAGLGYRVGEAGEIRVQGSYTDNPADRLQVGTVAGLPLFAQFDDYKAFGMDVGYRHYFGTAKTRPYVGAGGGFVRVDTIQSEFSVPAAGVVLSSVDMYDTSVVPSVGVGGGVQINLSDRFAVDGGVKFKWQGDAQDLDGLAGTGLESINDESRRWSMPITGGITVRF
jgi:opacity protein-like surface antigen